jgi:hypothetical protein
MGARQQDSGLFSSGIEGGYVQVTGVITLTEIA